MRSHIIVLIILVAAPLGLASAFGPEVGPLTQAVTVADATNPAAIVNVGDAVVYTSDDGIYRLTNDGTNSKLHDLGQLDTRDLEADANGNLYIERWPGLVRIDPAGELTAVSPLLHGRFGPDGLLYFARWNGLNPDGSGNADIVRMDSTRHLESVVQVPWVGPIAFAPDGTLLMASRAGSEVWRIHVDIGTYELVGHTSVGGAGENIAVDELGRIYIASGWSQQIERLDLTTGEDVTLCEGVSGQYASLAFLGTRLYFTNGQASWNTPPHPNTIAYCDAGVDGFVGYRPTFDLAPLADVQIESVAITSHSLVGQDDSIQVTIQNIGGSWLQGGWTLDASRATYNNLGSFCIDANGVVDQAQPLVKGCQEQGISSTTDTPTLAPGDSATFTFPWDRSTEAGTQDVKIDARTPYLFDGDLTNNIAHVSSDAKVGTPIGGI